MEELKIKYKEAMKSLIRKWDKEKLPDYKEDVTNQMIELRKRQKIELPTWDQIESRSKSVLKHSSAQVSELKRKQESLLQFGKYKEATRLDKLINKVKEQNTERNKNAILEKLNQKSQDIQRKHSKEISAMEMKIKKNWIVLWKQRQKDFDTVKKWYKNNKHDITQDYKQRWLKMDYYSPVVRMDIKNNISNFT